MGQGNRWQFTPSTLSTDRVHRVGFTIVIGSLRQRLTLVLRTGLRAIPGAISAVRILRRVLSVIKRIRDRREPARMVPAWFISGLPSVQYFVGYYDHSPFKPNDDDLLLVHSTRAQAWRRPSPHTPVSIQLIDWKNGSVVEELGESFAWNWQQGARALWLDSGTVVFNIYDAAEDRYRARMVSCAGVHLRDLPIAVQEIDIRGRVYSLSYEALAANRPDYGYRSRSPSARSIEDNAIEQFDPVTDRYRVLVKLSSLKNESAERLGSSVIRAKFNHVMASPDAGRLVFLFRYFLKGRRVTDLYVMSSEGGAPRLLVADSDVSHACWFDNWSMIVTMRGRKGFGYYHVQVDNSEAPELVWSQPDGHPSRLDEGHLVTDTYPDQYALRHLLVHSTKTGHTLTLGTFPEPLLFQGETRCDLHPSFSSSGRYIQVDCAVGQRRTVAVLENPLFYSAHT